MKTFTMKGTLYRKTILAATFANLAAEQAKGRYYNIRLAGVDLIELQKILGL